MTDHTDCQKKGTASQDTTISTGSLLYVTGVSVEESGIRYWINPYPKSLILAPLAINETKDTPHCGSIIPKNQNFIFVKTTENDSMIYHQKEKERREEGLEQKVLKIGEPIGEVILIID